MARAKQTARKQGARTPIDKGTYGSIKKSTCSSSSNVADKALSSLGGKTKKAEKLHDKMKKKIKVAKKKAKKAGLEKPSWKVRVIIVLHVKFLCSICSIGDLATSFDLHLPLFNCLCKSYVLMQVSIISLFLHKS